MLYYGLSGFSKHVLGAGFSKRMRISRQVSYSHLVSSDIPCYSWQLHLDPRHAFCIVATIAAYFLQNLCYITALIAMLFCFLAAVGVADYGL